MKFIFYYEKSVDSIMPVTIHAATRLQLKFRLKTGIFMNNAKMTYFKDEDILYLDNSDGQEANSVELYPNVTAELNDKDELIGLEILEASTLITFSKPLRLGYLIGIMLNMSK